MTEQGSSSNSAGPRAFEDEQGWRVCAGLTLREAEQLLDWLDQVGCPSREVQIDHDGTTVRWRPEESSLQM